MHRDIGNMQADGCYSIMTLVSWYQVHQRNHITRYHYASLVTPESFINPMNLLFATCMPAATMSKENIVFLLSTCLPVCCSMLKK